MIIEERRELLITEISNWVHKGFHVVSQTDTTVQLQQDKSTSCALLVVLLLCGILPGIIYILVSQDKHAYITVDKAGNINVKKDYSNESWGCVVGAVLITIIAICGLLMWYLEGL